MATQILEINLISAQGLKSPSSKIRRMQTYAMLWINASTKLRTRIDRDGAANPLWNDKFLFKVTPEFLSSETSAVSVEIYAAGYLRDHLIGTLRCLVSNLSLSAATKTPSFTAFQIRRPSGRFRGVLNVGAMLIDGSDFTAFDNVSAIGYRDLMGKGQRKEKVGKSKSKSSAEEFDAGDDDESWENSSCAGSQYSDGGDSTASSSSTTSTVLKDWNGINCLARKNCLRSASESMLCGLLMERKHRSRPSDENLDVYRGSRKNK
ncbi:Calcium-dependent lipid-binding domain-containing protein [Melia azedarach]|uniref:Calcium-dependent lipid-binding domain-containing protein n=1 Tax=Melia azedarach TaxID=155640 RepID=A0ACC1YWV5_MELAZ|nr:Calcium-dependent lipid-binding domain-containing protein [Melia azedarach]